MIDLNSTSIFCLVDLKGILLLLKFLEENQPIDFDASNDLLSATRMAIISSRALKCKINDFMNSLVMNMENIEDVWQITRSASKIKIFQYFDQDQYLQQSLLDPPSSDYMIKWAQYFLARSQSANDFDKEKSKLLLEGYINYLKRDQTHFTGVLKAIDKILGAFIQSSEHKPFRLTFIKRIIHLCFKQSISFDFISTCLLYRLFRFNFCDHYRWSSSRPRRSIS